MLAPARLELTGELIDLTDLPTRRRIEERHAELLRRGPVVAQTSPWRCQDVPGLPRPRSAPTCRTCRLFASIVALRRFCRRGLSRRRSRVRVPSLPLLFACISASLARSVVRDVWAILAQTRDPMDTEAAPGCPPAPGDKHFASAAISTSPDESEREPGGSIPCGKASSNDPCGAARAVPVEVPWVRGNPSSLAAVASANSGAGPTGDAGKAPARNRKGGATLAVSGTLGPRPQQKRAGRVGDARTRAEPCAFDGAQFTLRRRREGPASVYGAFVLLLSRREVEELLDVDALIDALASAMVDLGSLPWGSGFPQYHPEPPTPTAPSAEPPADEIPATTRTRTNAMRALVTIAAPYGTAPL